MCRVRGAVFQLTQESLCHFMLSRQYHPDTSLSQNANNANKTKGLRKYGDAIFTLFLSHSKSCLPGNHFFLREDKAIFQHTLHSLTSHHYTEMANWPHARVERCLKSIHFQWTQTALSSNLLSWQF